MKLLTAALRRFLSILPDNRSNLPLVVLGQGDYRKQIKGGAE